MCPAHLADQAAEELLEFLLVGDFEEFGGEFHLLLFAEDPFGFECSP